MTPPRRPLPNEAHSTPLQGFSCGCTACSCGHTACSRATHAAPRPTPATRAPAPRGVCKASSLQALMQAAEAHDGEPGCGPQVTKKPRPHGVEMCCCAAFDTTHHPKKCAPQQAEVTSTACRSPAARAPVPAARPHAAATHPATLTPHMRTIHAHHRPAGHGARAAAKAHRLRGPGV